MRNTKIVSRKVIIERASPEDALKVIKTCLVNVKFKEWFIKLLQQYLGDIIYQTSKSYTVKNDDLKMFEKLLSDKKQKTLSKDI
ncbi:MAG: hypothetical protein B6V02_02990 [Thermoprotei archaeon ex4572_64]|nr:MAG: hypothetical protein B6V02_02990 [Thermoprotei archaeon ex4572_64]